MSAPPAASATSTYAAACTASVNTTASGARRRTDATTSATGWITPVSLLAVITATTVHLDDKARASASRSSTPKESTGSSRTSAPISPAARADSRTAGCSTADTSTSASPVVERNAASTTPSTARLADSVPPEVKTISPGSRPKKAATESRASSNKARARCAGGWLPVGFPSARSWTTAIAAATSGRSAAVAAQSKYEEVRRSIPSWGW